MSRGHLVTHDWLTDTAGAAAVLRIKPGSLRTMRCYFGGLTVVPRGRHRLYSIAELAQRTRQRP